MKELICIQTHSRGMVKAGSVYNLISTRAGICKHYPILYNVGIQGKSETSECDKCGAILKKERHIYWFNPTLFAEIATNDEVIEAQKKSDHENKHYYTT